MSLLLLFALFRYSHSCALTQCLTLTEEDPEPKMAVCDEGLCMGPSFKVTTGYSAMEQKCGECSPSDTESLGCEDCYSDNCNTKKKVKVMMCNEYEKKTDKWVKKMEGEVGSEKEVMETCYKFDGDDDLCRRPLGDISQPLDSWCGECTSLTIAATCTNKPAPRLCVKSGETESVACNDGEPRSCVGPRFVTTTGYSAMKQKCGECSPSDTENLGCEDCARDNCNTKKDVENMMCNEYEWTTDKWVKKMEGEVGSETEVMETCYKFKGDDDMCKRPIGGQDSHMGTFCGACLSGSELLCTNKPVAGALGVSATILTLIAALFVLA